MAQKTMKLLSDEAISASEELAKERGAFPAFSESIYAESTPRRNATVTTIAPTGTISIIAGVSSGIEPVFSLAYERLALEKERFVFVHPALLKTLKDHDVRDRKLLAKILATGSVEFLNKIPAKSRRYLKTASEIPSRYHVLMQAAFQRYCDNAVSKTINLSFDVKPAQVKRIYEDAYRLKCKGITVYRDQSKSSQVLTRGVSQKSVRGLRTWLLDDEKAYKTIDQNAKKLRLLSKKSIST